MVDSQTYNLALVLEDATDHMREAGVALARMRSDLGPEKLSAIDLVYRPPSTLVSILRLAAGTAPEKVFSSIKSTAKAGFMRLLSASEMSLVEQHAGFDDPEHGLVIREENIRDFDPALERFRQFIQICKGEKTPLAPEPEVALAVTFASSDALIARYDRAKGLLVEGEGVLSLGQRVRVSLSTGSGQGPIALSARVVEVNDPTGQAPARKPGFVLGLLLPPEERDNFDSFLIAVRRAQPWPSESGRHHDRFGIELKVVYTHNGERRREATEDFSRGGMFVCSYDPPAQGTLLDLSLYARGNDEPVSLQAKVVNVIDAHDATTRGGAPGFGVQFTEDPEVIRPLIERLLAASPAPARRLALLADDDRFFRSVLGNVLRSAGFEVLEAVDGDAAVRLFGTSGRHIDLLVADLYMPGLTGIELIDHLRRVNQVHDLPVVMVSGATLTEADTSAIARLGADDVLTKTLSPEQMLERIEAALDKRARV